MKKFIQSNPVFRALSEFCKKNVDNLGDNLQRVAQQNVNDPNRQDLLNEEQRAFKQQRAARLIQRFWRLAKIRRAFAENAWKAYFSLVNSSEEYFQISTMMFGRHVAELRLNDTARSTNPYLPRDSSQFYYHRYDDITETIRDALLLEFDVDSSFALQKKCIPVSLLKNTPIEDVINRHVASISSSYTLCKKADCSIALFFIQNQEDIAGRVKQILGAAGVIASFWEIAETIRYDFSYLHPQNTNDSQKISAILGQKYSKFPLTRIDLLIKDPQVQLLYKIANNPDYPTHRLALCLYKIIHQLPPLGQASLQRIALMLELAHTFYSRNYSQYAFVVYVILHELSLYLLKPNQSGLFEKYYSDFLLESEACFFQCFGLQQSEVQESVFIAAPALSGTNAFAIALRLASTMKTLNGDEAVWGIISPEYYEFSCITRKAVDSFADIYLISAGPIVDKFGLSPGIDINLFINLRFMTEDKPRPIALIIDATTALYKNLQLGPFAKSLVSKGQLSLIIHESHQKFGLLHSDQAQYGRVLALCSKQFFSESVLNQVKEDSWMDYRAHVDLRIGAFISAACGNTLEAIKQQHFKNGALFGKSQTIIGHNYMLNYPEEHYFYCSSNARFVYAAQTLFDSRDSFGHYVTTRACLETQVRISPDASDTLDILIQKIQLELVIYYHSQCSIAAYFSTLVLKYARRPELLELEDQLVCLALLTNLVIVNKIRPIYFIQPLIEDTEEALDAYLMELGADVVSMKEIIKKIGINWKRSCNIERLNWLIHALELPVAMENLLKQCDLLKGRHAYMRVQHYILELQHQVLNAYYPENRASFFPAIRVLYENDIQLTEALIPELKKKPSLCLAILQIPEPDRTMRTVFTLMQKHQYDVHSYSPGFFKVPPLENADALESKKKEESSHFKFP